MAFYNKIGSLMKQTNGHVSMPSMFNVIRSMSSSQLFIGGLSYGTDDLSLKEAFTSFGEVSEAKIIIDRDTGKSRGFGFVSFADTESAAAALSAMDGQALHGRNIRVSYANDRTGNSGSGNRGYRGGYGDGGSSDRY